MARSINRCALVRNSAANAMKNEKKVTAAAAATANVIKNGKLLTHPRSAPHLGDSRKYASGTTENN